MDKFVKKRIHWDLPSCQCFRDTACPHLNWNSGGDLSPLSEFCSFHPTLLIKGWNTHTHRHTHTTNKHNRHLWNQQDSQIAPQSGIQELSFVCHISCSYHISRSLYKGTWEFSCDANLVRHCGFCQVVKSMRDPPACFVEWTFTSRSYLA